MKTTRYTAATMRRLACLYREWIGYDPFEEGWTVPEVLETLREYRREGYLDCDRAEAHLV